MPLAPVSDDLLKPLRGILADKAKKVALAQRLYDQAAAKMETAKADLKQQKAEHNRIERIIDEIENPGLASQRGTTRSSSRWGEIDPNSYSQRVRRLLVTRDRWKASEVEEEINKRYGPDAHPSARAHSYLSSLVKEGMADRVEMGVYTPTQALRDAVTAWELSNAPDVDDGTQGEAEAMERPLPPQQ